MDMSLTEKLAYSTVRIECELDSGNVCTGTGYFFSFKDDPEKQEFIPVVITNKHVIKNAVKGKLIFTVSKNGKPVDTEHFGISIKDFEKYWTLHPNSDVDLCAMPIAPFITEASKCGKELYYLSLDKNLIPNNDKLKNLSAVEEILMVGYPNGIWDSINNKPIYRKGITATHPCIDYNGKKRIYD